MSYAIARDGRPCYAQSMALKAHQLDRGLRFLAKKCAVRLRRDMKKQLAKLRRRLEAAGGEPGRLVKGYAS